jgi:hypothetical protein
VPAAVTVGTPFTGSIRFNQALADSNLDPLLGTYQHAQPLGPFGLSLTIGSFSYSDQPDADLTELVEIDSVSELKISSHDLSASLSQYPTVSNVFSLVDLEGPAGAITSDQLVTSVKLSDFTNLKSFRVTGLQPNDQRQFEFEGPITSFRVVPEPSSGVLAAIGIGLLRVSGRRRTTRRCPLA